MKSIKTDSSDRGVYGLLSLCKKAGKVRSGEVPVTEAITSGEARLLLIAQDASENSKKKIQDRCEYRGIPWVIFGSMEDLGRAMGVSERAGAAVTDPGFARAIKKRLAASE